MKVNKVVPAKEVKATKKVAPKKAAAKKEPKVREVRIPETGWGFTPEALKKIRAVAVKEGFFTLSDFIRAAAKKAYGISND